MKQTVDLEREVVLEPATETRIAKTADVIVAGGSMTGVSAAIAAARNGADTLLVDRFGFLGGQWTAGLVCSPHRSLPCSRGEHGEYPILIEALRRCVEAADAGYTWEDVENDPSIDVSINPEVAKYVFVDMVEEAGVRLLLHSLVVDTIVQDGTVKGIIVENKGGRSALLGKVVVDATGDGDVAVRAGAPFTTRPVEDRWTPAVSMYVCGADIASTYEYLIENPDEYGGRAPLEECSRGVEGDFRQRDCNWSGFPRLLAEAAAQGEFADLFTQSGFGFYWQGRGVATLSGGERPVADCLDPDELTEAEVMHRKKQWETGCFLRKYVPGFEESSLIVTGAHIGVRETRALVTEHVLRLEDVETSRQFDDTVFRFPQASASAVRHMITHHPAPSTDGVVGEVCVPYRTMIPKGMDNLLAAGRCVAYMIASGGYLGQVAGTAAALSVRAGVTTKQLDVPTLRQTLLQQGCSYGTITP